MSADHQHPRASLTEHQRFLLFPLFLARLLYQFGVHLAFSPSPSNVFISQLTYRNMSTRLTFEGKLSV